MKRHLYTWAYVGDRTSRRPAAEIFLSKRGVLTRRLAFAEVNEAQKSEILRLFDRGDAAAYERTLNELESEVSLVRLSLYELPAGLAADQEVLVLSCDPRTYNHLVRDESGREWTIKARQNLDAESEYRVSHR